MSAAMDARSQPNGRAVVSAIVAAALDLAGEGWPVFPCGADKKPLTTRGFKDASTDPETIRAAFGKKAARLIAVPTGAISGFDVLDLDPRHGSDAWRVTNLDRLPETRTHVTPNGGEHFLFLHADGVRNSAGKIAPGVDVRGEGGYVCVPPAGSYRLANGGEIAPWPPELLHELLRQPEPPSASPAIEPQQKTDQLAARYRGYVESLLHNVRNAPDGQKHGALLANARSLGGILSAAGISEADAHMWLTAALPETVADWNNATKTATDGLRAGLAAPFDLPDRQQRASPAPPRAERGNGHDHGGHGSAASDAPEPVAEADPPGQEPRKRKKRANNALALVEFMAGSRDWRGALRVNLFTETMQVCDQFPPLRPHAGAFRPLREPSDLLEAMLHFQGVGFAKAGKALVWDGLCAMAHRNAFHPVQDYLDSLRWDGVSRLGKLFQHYFNGEVPDEREPPPEPNKPTPHDAMVSYLEHISLCFVVSAVARIRQPGCKVDHVPVLVSPQGYNKSQAIRALCADPAWFSDDLSTDLMERDTKESLTGKWIVELAEMPHAKKEVERVKAFFSRQTDRYRRAYDRTTNDWPRQCVFVGSSNDLEMIDNTGNRRFWPVELAGSINVAAIAADRDQLWAEAVTLFERGHQWWLAANIEAIAGEQQGRFQDEDIWTGLLSKWTEGEMKTLEGSPVYCTEPFTLADAMALALGFLDPKQIPKVDQNRAAGCLKSLGFQRRKMRVGGSRPSWWWWSKTRPGRTDPIT